jgi:hypothetical protein
MKKVKSALASLGWLFAGYLSWYLSIYLFSYFFVSPAMNGIDNINQITNYGIFRALSIMFHMHFVEFVISFIFVALLSFLVKSNWNKLLLFFIGSAGLSVYIKMDNLITYFGKYPKLPDHIIRSAMESFISLLIIMPIVIYCGYRAGIFLRKKLRTL